MTPHDDEGGGTERREFGKTEAQKAQEAREAQNTPGAKKAAAAKKAARPLRVVKKPKGS